MTFQQGSSFGTAFYGGARGHREARFVACYAPPEEFEELGALLGDRNFRLVTGPDLTKGVGPSGGFAAAIVSDAREDAFEICRRLNTICPIVLLTSDMSLAVRRRAVHSGVDAVVVRPVNQAELSDWLEQLGSMTAHDPISIAIVDDDEMGAEIYAAALSADGMHATTINDPLVALEQLRNLRPDLILTDLNMPALDGSELIRLIRQCREFASTPIVCLSAESCPTKQIEARSHGADDFIAKPVDIVKLVSIIRTRTERFRFLRSLIERDSLTGLLTHARLKDRIAMELERCGRTSGRLSFAMVDIDHFKKINDRFGHPFGDVVIRGLSRMLRQRLRKIDVIGRYGGEEFGVLFLDTPAIAARRLVDNLRRRFSETRFESSRTPVHVTFSAGIASNQPGICLDRLIAQADGALYRAKREGRNCVELAGGLSVPKSKSA